MAATLTMSNSSDYPEHWDVIAWWIKEEAGWACEHCGHDHDPDAGHCLTVHHLDGDKTNCAWPNLVALCQKCHLHIQARWRPGQPWLFGRPFWAFERGLGGK